VNNVSSLPVQARRQAGCKPKSEGATATERGRGLPGPKRIQTYYVKVALFRLYFVFTILIIFLLIIFINYFFCNPNDYVFYINVEVFL
jgi:hypothetical protein